MSRKDKLISVEDDLPKNSDPVLVCSRSYTTNFTDCSDYAIAYYSNNEWHPDTSMLMILSKSKASVIRLSEKVTHWMPLPRLPDKI